MAMWTTFTEGIIFVGLLADRPSVPEDSHQVFIAIDQSPPKMYLADNSLAWNLVGSGGSTTLAGLTDVTLTSTQTDDNLIYTGSVWENIPFTTKPRVLTTSEVIRAGREAFWHTAFEVTTGTLEILGVGGIL